MNLVLGGGFERGKTVMKQYDTSHDRRHWYSGSHNDSLLASIGDVTNLENMCLRGVENGIKEFAGGYTGECNMRSELLILSSV
jgi:hypothetical protein